MDKEANIAVCVLFFEKADQTIECVASFASSKMPIYILNNNSSDESTKKLKAYCSALPQVKIFDSPKNLGVSGGRNYLISNTEEEWLFFVDNDITIRTEDWPGIISELINSEKEMDAFIPKLYNLHDNMYVDHKPFIIRNKTLIRDEDFQGDVINRFSGGASIVNRKLFERLGAYSEEMFVGFEDYEMALRAMTGGRPIRAKVISSIELVHDHRTATNPADKQSLSVRYDVEKHKRSSEYMRRKYGIRTSPSWRYWLENQRGLMLWGKEIRPIGYIKRIRLKMDEFFWRIKNL